MLHFIIKWDPIGSNELHLNFIDSDPELMFSESISEKRVTLYTWTASIPVKQWDSNTSIGSATNISNMKLYSVSDGPPSLACRQALKALKIDYDLIDVDFGKGEHMTEEYAKVKY